MPFHVTEAYDPVYDLLMVSGVGPLRGLGRGAERMVRTHGERRDADGRVSRET